MQNLDDSRLLDLKSRVKQKLSETTLFKFKGTVSKLLGLTVEVKLPGLKIGDLCYIETDSGEKKPAEVVAFKGEAVLVREVWLRQWESRLLFRWEISFSGV